ncbi:MAG TPA: alpha-L-fucosidase [Terracidiphilus sp.]|nr:alpha-L-fucosidase [Terracidiphilus sp.]
MTLTRRDFVVGSVLSFASARAFGETVGPPAPFGVLPSPRQLHWQRMETNAFVHFTVNTFTDKEWGEGDEDPTIFNPEGFDADAIVLALKAGGMQGVILTCKHHDGFCLWPTKTTDHCIRFSHWKDGKGDIVGDLSRAALRHGMKFGVYASPWDRNNANYGKPEYIATYRQQLTELLTWYGPIFEVWFDGANGGSGYYGGARETRKIDKHIYYDWPTTWALVRKLQPDAVIFSDVGPDIRWVGNETGIAGETCWATCDPVSEDGSRPAVPGDAKTDVLNSGTRSGSHWLPAECDVSIRPGWFWHEQEDNRVKTPEELVDLYFQSVGRGANLLLNAPPNRHGHFSPQDVASITGFHQRLQALFSENLAAQAKLHASNVRSQSKSFGPQMLLDGDPDTYWATDDAVHTPELTIDFGPSRKLNVLRLREAIQLGQRIGAFAWDAWRNGAWMPIAQATSIGSCRLIRLPQAIETSRLRLRITESPACIALADLGVFLQE